jgi:hypothetical protein
MILDFGVPPWIWLKITELLKFVSREQFEPVTSRMKEKPLKPINLLRLLTSIVNWQYYVTVHTQFHPDPSASI